ncbi:MAG: histidine--tRNA ligase [Candidatus Omnitrophota bacterium]
MKYKSIRGMEDILPEEAGRFRALEEKARRELSLYGFMEIRTPILEGSDLFVRGIGDATDIVTKEMYTFSDRKGRSLTLRPEGTASVVRAYIEHSLDNVSPDMKLYYIGPMFRSERPQKGRSRQFHQVGAEIVGAASPYADAELISQMDLMIAAFGVSGHTIKINSLGCPADKAKFADSLRKYLTDKKAMLCRDCNGRIDRNVLRTLDCKNDACKTVVKQAPSVCGCLCPDCRGHFQKLTDALDRMGVKFITAGHLVRGLDYYTGTVFEITHPKLGGQDAMGAGGRYDKLVEDLGGPDMPAIGYALGIERILIVLGDKYAGGQDTPQGSVYIATLGDSAKIEGMKLAVSIRSELGMVTQTDIREASLKAQFRAADKLGCKHVVVIGDDELKKEVFVLRDMSAKTQENVPRDRIVERLRSYRNKREE